MTLAPGRKPLARALALLTAVLACSAALAVWSPPRTAAAASTHESSALERRLYDLLLADRYRAGLYGLAWNGTMTAYAAGASYQPCSGTTAHGRAQDMAERNYFSHQAPPCAGTVFPTLTAAGLQMQAWGENIAWTLGNDGSSADTVNSSFMQSAGHRANVLGDFNSVGIGVVVDSAAWTPAGGKPGAIVYSVLFARIPGVVPPRPPVPPPAPAPRPQPPAPAPAPVVPDAAVAAAAPAPEPTAATLAVHSDVARRPGATIASITFPGGYGRDLQFFLRSLVGVALVALVGAVWAWLRVRRSS